MNIFRRLFCLPPKVIPADTSKPAKGDTTGGKVLRAAGLLHKSGTPIDSGNHVHNATPINLPPQIAPSAPAKASDGIQLKGGLRWFPDANKRGRTINLVKDGEITGELVACGAGKMVYPDGSSCTGTFLNSMRQGPDCTYTFADGSVYTGGYVLDKKDTHGSKVIAKIQFSPDHEFPNDTYKFTELLVHFKEGMPVAQVRMKQEFPGTRYRLEYQCEVKNNDFEPSAPFIFRYRLCRAMDPQAELYGFPKFPHLQELIPQEWSAGNQAGRSSAPTPQAQKPAVPTTAAKGTREISFPPEIAVPTGDLPNEIKSELETWANHPDPIIKKNRKLVLENVIEPAWNKAELDFTLDKVSGIRERLQQVEYDKCLNELPDAIRHFKHLKAIKARHWEKSSEPKMLPSWIGELTNLEVIELEHMKYTGIPREIGNLKRLRVLNLSNNQISQVPEEIGNLVNLTSLKLSNNKITLLPEQICNLDKLRELIVCENEIKQLPHTLGNLTQLQTLLIYQNSLEDLPQGLENLNNLTNVMLDIIPEPGDPLRNENSYKPIVRFVDD